MNKRAYYLTKRTLKTGRKVYYYYYYDRQGNRSVPKSTGCSRRNDAENYCTALFKNDKIYASSITFGEFAEGWFKDGHEWLEERKLTKPLSVNTLRSFETCLRLKILPYFKDYKLADITTGDIRRFQTTLTAEGKVANLTINTLISILKIMFNWAVEQEYVFRNPVHNIITLKQKTYREAFTEEQLIFLFGKKWDIPQAWLYCLTGAVTGMRFSEIKAITVDRIHDGYIEIDRQLSADNEFIPIKTREKRFVTVPKLLLDMLIRQAGNYELVFHSTLTFGVAMSTITIRNELYKNYNEEMKIAKKEKLLTFHAFRHFFNTYMFENNIQETKLNFLIGHSSGKGSMLELYTTWKPEMYKDVLELQEKLLARLLENAPKEYYQATE